MTSPRILYWDIETAPMLEWVWNRWMDGALAVEQDSYILAVSYVWNDAKTPKVLTLSDYPNYDPAVPNDLPLLEQCHELMNQADITVAHNGDKFDHKVMNARYVINGLPPTKPTLQVDTLKTARRHFKFESNKLDELGRVLGLGNKVSTGGYGLWAGCMQGDPAAWRKMKQYNKRDVTLLRDVYKKLLPWDTSHPNVQGFTGHGCTRCGSPSAIKRGFYRTKTAKYQQYQCNHCGGYFRDRKSEAEKPHFTH